MGDTYSLHDLEYFSNCLHVNTFLCLWVNVTAIVLILKNSPKAMGTYKYYLLNMNVAAMVFDVHVTFIFAPFPAFTVGGFCGYGLLTRHLDYFYGEIVQFTVMHFTLSYCGLSLMWGVMHRFRAVDSVSVAHGFKFDKSLAAMALITLFYPLPSVLMHCLALESHDTVFAAVAATSKELSELFRQAPCYALSISGRTLAYFGTMMGQISLVYGIIVTVSIRTYKTLKTRRQNFSEKTYQVHKQLLVALWCQCLVPFVMMFVPLLICVVIILTHPTNVKVISMIAIQCLTLHSSVNGLMTVVLIRPYREALLRLLPGFIAKSANNTVSQKSNVYMAKT